MNIPISQQQGNPNFVGLEKRTMTAAFALTTADDGRHRLVTIARVRLPLWPKSRQSRHAVTAWARWRLSEALSGEGRP